jgi:hypothetical protein
MENEEKTDMVTTTGGTSVNATIDQSGLFTLPME